MTTIVNEKGMLLGVFTDGDLRRVIDSKINLSSALIKDVMSPNPKTINQGILAAETLNIMQQNSITAVIVEDEKKHPVGVVHMHDILRAGVI
jgi:arabinose-5-phosphate isomerase